MEGRREGDLLIRIQGLLTPAQKLSRRKIVPLYQREIDGVYGKTKSVL
jgi:long-chain acyl-CoA synthetase